MSSVVTRHAAPIAAVALAFTAAYTLAIGSAGGDSPHAQERADAVVAPPTTVAALRDVAQLPALRPAPKPRAPVVTRAAVVPPSPSPTPVPVATATPPPPPPPPPAVTPQPAAPQPTPEPTFDSSG